MNRKTIKKMLIYKENTLLRGSDYNINHKREKETQAIIKKKTKKRLKLESFVVSLVVFNNFQVYIYIKSNTWKM